jgi:flagellar biosynthesis chaperone FliJ
LDGKIRKCEKELKALANTLEHLKKRNQNFRDKFIQGAEGADLEKKQILEDQCRAASETLFKKRRELQKLQKEYDDDMRRLMEIQTKVSFANSYYSNKHFLSKMTSLIT